MIHESYKHNEDEIRIKNSSPVLFDRIGIIIKHYIIMQCVHICHMLTV